MTCPQRSLGRSGSESGFSLIEVLIAVSIVGITFVGLLGAMATTVLSSGRHRAQAVAEVEVRRYAELVTAATWDPAGGYSASGVGYVVGPAGSAPYSLVSDAPVTSCSPVACGSVGVQIQTITVAVHSADGEVQEPVQLVKRAP